jgi:hypothetical protein
MLTDIGISGVRNVIKKEAERIYKDLSTETNIWHVKPN